jgi:APA family basic amino acid/polyamine antiporter
VGLSLFLGTLIVCCIYVLANLILAVVPLQDIATAPADRVGVGFAIYFGGIGTLIIAVMIMISTFCLQQWIDHGRSQRYYTMAKDGVFQESC